MQSKAWHVQIITITLLLAIVVCSAVPASFSQSAMAVYDIGISVTNPTPVVYTGETVTAIVTSGGSPAPGVSVVMKVTFPDSTIYTSSAANTDGTGKVTFPFTVSKIAGTNTITIIADASQNSLTIVASPDVPSKLVIKPMGNVLSVGGTATLPDNGVVALPVVAVLTDKYDNPIKGSTVNISNNDGMANNYITDDLGAAGPMTMGPSLMPRTITATAKYSNLTSTFNVNFADCLLDASLDKYIVTVGDNVTATGTVRINNTLYGNIPVKFRIWYDPHETYPTYTYTVNTTAGTSVKLINTSSSAGPNNIEVAVDELGMYQTLTVRCINGTPAQILINTTVVGNKDPVSGKAYADGNTFYHVRAKLIDAHGNPIEGVSVSFDQDGYVIENVTTNENGVSFINSVNSNIVDDVLLTVYAENYCYSTVNLSFVAGPAQRIFVRANPNVIASSDVDDSAMTDDPHCTNISAIVTDEWYHPIVNKQVRFSVKSGNGTISALQGMTDDTGTFTSKFTLNHSTPNDARAPTSSPFYGIATVRGEFTTDVSTVESSLANIIYTNDSFLSVEADIKPLNATVGKPINIYVNISGIGWQVKPKPADVFLIQDYSGSMDWYADIVQNNSFEIYAPAVKDENGIASGTIPKGTNFKTNAQWYKVGTYHHDNKSSVTSFDIMYGWDWRNYLPGAGGGTGSGNTYYLMRILTPDKNAYEPSGATTPTGYTHKDISPGYGLTETIWTVNNAKTAWSGDYEIWAFYQEGTVAGASPYRLSVETNTKRIRAAKDACKEFVTDVAPYDRVGYIPYGGEVKNKVPLMPMTDANKDTLRAKIEAQGSIGSTKTWIALQDALDSFNATSTDPNVRRSIVLVTDGYSYNPAEDRAKADIAKSMGVTIYTVGIGACDDATLKYINTTTGGKYYHASNRTDLVNTFKEIATYMHETVAEHSSISLVSDRSLVNGTWENNTEYIAGSAYKKTPLNLNWTSTEPDEPTILNSTDGYTLTWTPGEIHINQKWSLKYQLLVKHNGTNGVITPITNKSFIWFERSGQAFTTYLDASTAYVGNNTGTPDEEWIRVNITYPTEGANVTENVIDTKWTVWYNWSEWYNQMIFYTYESGEEVKIADLAGADNSSSPRNYHYLWDVTDMAPGYYTIKVKAYDTIGHEAVSTVRFYRPDMHGKIILS